VEGGVDLGANAVEVLVEVEELGGHGAAMMRKRGWVLQAKLLDSSWLRRISALSHRCSLAGEVPATFVWNVPLEANGCHQ
jgi:hypothetical protein